MCIGKRTDKKNSQIHSRSVLIMKVLCVITLEGNIEKYDIYYAKTTLHAYSA